MHAAREVYITWNDSRRSASLCERVGLERVVLVAERRGALRHAYGVVHTIRFLLRQRPELVWYQFSLALGAVLALYRLLSGSRVRLLADLHTKALRRSGPWFAAPLVHAVKGWSLRQGHAMVANGENAEYARARFGIDPLILSDPLPTPPPLEQPRTRSGEVLVVNSFAPDEPITLLCEVAEGSGLRLSVTGNPATLPAHELTRTARSLELTGWLPDTEYWRRLRDAGAVVVLSTEAACLPCGAYEAIAVGQRPVLRDDPVVRAVFGDAARYTPLENDELASAIRAALLESHTDRDHPDVRRIAAFAKKWEVQWLEVRGRLAQRGLLPQPPVKKLLGQAVAGV